MHKVYLKPGKEESLKRFHPWIFSGAIARFDGEPEEGEVVEVYTSKKEFIAEGHFQIGSIAVRVLSFRQEPIDHDFWKRKLQLPMICVVESVSQSIPPMTPTVLYTVRETICLGWSLTFMPGLPSCRRTPQECM